MGHAKQKSFFKTHWKHQLCHGGVLRQKRAGRGQRPLSTKEPLHLVFKVNRERLRHGTLRSPIGYTLISQIVRRYAKKFFVKVEQISIQGDHCHLLIRASRRAKYHAFFRVVAGQIAQRFQLEALIKPDVTDTPAGLCKGKEDSNNTALWEGRVLRKGTARGESNQQKKDMDSSQSLNRSEDIAERKRPDLRKGTDLPRGTDQRKETDLREGTALQKGAHLRKDMDPSKDAKRRDSEGLAVPGTKLWKYRPFSRVVRGYRAYQVVRDYVQLNELEAQGKIPYRKSRLKGLSSTDWEILWA